MPVGNDDDGEDVPHPGMVFGRCISGVSSIRSSMHSSRAAICSMVRLEDRFPDRRSGRFQVGVS